MTDQHATADKPAGEIHPTIARLVTLLRSDQCQQMRANGPDRIFYIDHSRGLCQIPADALDEQLYIDWIRHLIDLTDVGQLYGLDNAPTPFIEGSFLKDRFDVAGSIHVATVKTTRTLPAITIRKQPRDKITLDQMVSQNMMVPRMKALLDDAVNGRLNLLISGGSGAGKTTLARALSLCIDPTHRMCTAEEIDELHVGQHLPDTVAMTTWKRYDDYGTVRSEVTLEQLVREALRMRPDRIWVGETRGQEAYALVKACNSGHDGSATTVHGDTGQQAVKQLISYVMESHLSEEAASDQVARAFHLVVQISKTSPSTRVIAEITELEPVREGSEQRRNPLWKYNVETESFDQIGRPTRRLVEAAKRYGVDIEASFT